MKKKKYKWNKKTFFKNLGKGLLVLTLCIAYDLAIFYAFFEPVLH